MTKVCSKCKVRQALSDFYTRNTKPIAACKRCVSEATRQYREEHLDIVRAREVAYYKAHTDMRIASARAYRAANSERVRDKDKIWRAANIEKIRAQKKAWSQANREKRRIILKKYRVTHREECKCIVKRGRMRTLRNVEHMRPPTKKGVMTCVNAADKATRPTALAKIYVAECGGQ